MLVKICYSYDTEGENCRTRILLERMEGGNIYEADRLLEIDHEFGIGVGEY